jgi:hypothetical protein
VISRRRGRKAAQGRAVLHSGCAAKRRAAAASARSAVECGASAHRSDHGSIRSRTIGGFAAVLLWGALAASHAEAPFAIHVTDEATGRGVPMIELETVNRVLFVTDSAGHAAIDDPELTGRKIFFHVRGHGYLFPPDGFGSYGRALEVKPGGKAELKVQRVNIAERLYRITGEGIYRDTVLLGLPRPFPTNNGQVAGQDSVQAALYGGRIHWFWGDTARMEYALGHFRMSGATSPLSFDPAIGVPLEYFVGENGFARPMWPVVSGKPSALVWSDGFSAVPDRTGRERLLAHYSQRLGLDKQLGHGLSVFNDATRMFDEVRTLPADELWRFPKGHPVRGRDALDGYVLFRAEADAHAPFLAVRARATVESLCDLPSYEAFTCLRPGTGEVEREASGAALWAWKRDAAPLTQRTEAQLIRDGKLRAEDARYQVRDAETGKPIELHAGSVRWNAYRKKWVMIVSQRGGTSMLGEIWFSEADDVTGPWRTARKIVTHDRQSFYNPVHHDFLDQDGGRLIYFEGTYSNEFSGPVATPRYQYNQIMYRLDLSDPRLSPAAR